MTQQHRPFEVAIVGNDLLLAALPGRPLQVAHAVHASGFDLVVPVSWGEELLARHALDALTADKPQPLIFGACPKVRSRLLGKGQELAPHLLMSVAPPAAAARYLRALQPDVRLRITFIGECPGAADTSIDARIPPPAFLLHLERLGISVTAQPTLFESVIPPDRRRHYSLPGGVPAADAAAERGFPLSLLTNGAELAADLAEHLMAAEQRLVDIGQAVGCSCAMGGAGSSRDGVIAIEPPRAPLPVLDGDVQVNLELAPRLTLATSTTESAREGAPEYAPARVVRLQNAATTRSAKDAAARRRAERLRIAVTPPGARQVVPARIVPSRSSTGPIEAPASPAGAPVVDLTFTAPVEAPPVVPMSPVEEVRPGVTPVEPPPVSPETPPTPTTDMPSIAQPEVPAGAPSFPEAPSRETRRHTPVYGVWRLSRSTARQRMVTREGAAWPRALGTVRTRSLEVPAIVQAVEVTPTVVHVEPAATVPPAIAPVEPVRGWPAEESGRDARRRASSRRIDQPEVSPAARLWGLLMSVIIITALTIILFLMFRS